MDGDPEDLPTFGHSMGRNRRTYDELQPEDHTRVCFSAAIGRAMRGRPSTDHGEEAGRRALAMLADGTAACICTRPRNARSRRR